MKIELKDSEVGEFHDGRDTELWVATRWIVFSSSYCIVIKTKKKNSIVWSHCIWKLLF